MSSWRSSESGCQLFSFTISWHSLWNMFPSSLDTTTKPKKIESFVRFLHFRRMNTSSFPVKHPSCFQPSEANQEVFIAPHTNYWYLGRKANCCEPICIQLWCSSYQFTSARNVSSTFLKETVGLFFFSISVCMCFFFVSAWHAVLQSNAGKKHV